MSEKNKVEEEGVCRVCKGKLEYFRQWIEIPYGDGSQGDRSYKVEGSICEECGEVDHCG